MQAIHHSYRVNDSVVAAELDNEMVLLNIETGIYFGLDELGTQIWSMLSSNRTEESIIEELMSEYDVEREQVHDDVLEFLTQLRAKELVFFDEC